MVAKILTICNVSGLHARPAGAFVTLAKKYASNVTLEKDGKKVNGKSVFSVMSACITHGTQITLEVDGPDEADALAALAAAVKQGLGEAVE